MPRHLNAIKVSMLNLKVLTPLAAGLLAAALAILLPGCDSPSPSRPSFPEATAVFGPTNILHEGDTLDISFQYSTNFNSVQKISFDGTLNLQSIGQIKAAGKTVPDLQNELFDKYRPLVKDDVLTIKLLSAAAVVYVSGSVIRPGSFPLERPMTVMEAIMAAGGFDPNRALLSRVIVLRLESGRQKVYHVNAKRILNGDDQTPFYLKPYDIVDVPAKTLSF
jgi:protein involved in polysaccharide export with SLBB domain